MVATSQIWPAGKAKCLQVRQQDYAATNDTVSGEYYNELGGHKFDLQAKDW